MKTLTTRNGSYTTGDGVADAVMRYGLALSRQQSVELINIPFTAQDGSIQRAELRIGWNVDIAAISTVTSPADLGEADTITMLDAKAHSLGTVTAHSFGPEDSDDAIWRSFDDADF